MSGPKHSTAEYLAELARTFDRFEAEFASKFPNDDVHLDFDKLFLRFRGSKKVMVVTERGLSKMLADPAWSLGDPVLIAKKPT